MKTDEIVKIKSEHVTWYYGKITCYVCRKETKGYLAIGRRVCDTCNKIAHQKLREGNNGWK